MRILTGFSFAGMYRLRKLAERSINQRDTRADVGPV